jgi:hypothetical protein
VRLSTGTDSLRFGLFNDAISAADVLSGIRLKGLRKAMKNMSHVKTQYPGKRKQTERNRIKERA